MGGIIGGLVGLAVLLLLLPMLPKPERRRVAKDAAGMTEAQRNRLIALGAGALILLVVWLLIGSWPIALLFSLGGAGVPGWLDEIRRQRRNQRLVEQMEVLMSRLASAMAGGGIGPEHAWVEAAAEIQEEPLHSELKHIVDELQVGRSLADTLRSRGRHLGITEFDLIATSTAVMGSLGGNLVDRYRSAGEMLGNRRADKATIQSLTTETRASVHVIGAIPLLVFGAMRYMAPEMLDPLLHTGPGLILTGVALGVVAAGYLWAQRMARLDR